MNSLPPEILHCVFIQLPLPERQKCMLVCRHWCRALRARSLLYDVFLPHEDRREKFIDLIQRQPSLAKQVEILKINYQDDSLNFDCRKFCNMLPNLRVYINTSVITSELERTTHYCSTLFELVNPDSKLEKLQDSNECEITRQILMSGSFNRLVTLKLSMVQIDSRSEVFPFLKDIPILKNLSVTDCHIGIFDCEILHENLPSISCLEIEYSRLESDQLPAHIIPNTSVTRLRVDFDDEGDFEGHAVWYQYLSKKYTNLRFFSFDDCTLGKASIDDSRLIYERGLIPLYKSIDPPLEWINVVNVPPEVEIFNKLDDFDCKINELKLTRNKDGSIFSQLAQSKQSKYVQHIYMHLTNIDSPQMFQNMTALRLLHMCINSNVPINLTEYMNAFPPSLTEFTIICTDVEISELPSRQNNIRTMSICGPGLPNLFHQVIATCCPKLTNFVGIIAE